MKVVCLFSLNLAHMVLAVAFGAFVSSVSNELNVDLEHSAVDKNCISNNKTACSCEMNDGSGIIDLTSIGYKTKPRFKDFPAPDGAMYSYNPCYGFTEGKCINSAVCMKKGNTTLTIGEASPVYYQYDADLKAVVMAYRSRQEKVLEVIVELLCDYHACEPVFEPVGGDEWGLYLFKMRSVCACPGMCSSSGATVCESSSSILPVGTILCIGVLVAMLSYLLCGMLYNKLINKSSGSDVIPHKKFWSSLPVRVKEGVMFSCSCCLSRTHAYHPAPSSVQ